MRLFFWDFDDVNDIQRQWAMFIINCIAVLFTSYCLVRTAKFHKKVIFELLPLSINTIATLILLMIKLFQKGYEFDLVAFVIEIFTYFLFCYTFSLLHARILQRQSRPVKKVCNSLLVILAVGSLVVIILVLASVIQRKCDNNLIEANLACLATQFISFLPTLYFGIDLLKNMDRKSRQQKQHQIESQQQNSAQVVLQTISDTYIRQRKKQIKLVIITYAISLVLRGLILLFNFAFEDSIICSQFDDVTILTSDQVQGQILLVLIQINQLIPHLMIPIALFVVPVGRQNRSMKITLQSTLIEEEEEHDHGDIIQRRISRTIVSNRGSVLNDGPDELSPSSPRRSNRNFQ